MLYQWWSVGRCVSTLHGPGLPLSSALRSVQRRIVWSTSCPPGTGAALDAGRHSPLCTTDWQSGLAAVLGPRRGRKLWGGNGQPHKCALEGESLKTKTCLVTALGPRRPDKDGAGCLDTDSALGVTGFFLCFVEEIGLELGSPQFPQIGQPFNKDLFPSPSIFVLCLWVQQHRHNSTNSTLVTKGRNV